MPGTLQYRPILIDRLVSNQRINSYHHVFQPADDVGLMGAYLWNAHVSGAFHPIVGAAEVTLRNAIDSALQPLLGNFWWGAQKLRYRSFTPNAPAPDPVKSVRDNFAKATRKFIADQRRRYNIQGHITPTHHGVMAKTEFSTWEFILDAEFMGNGLIWPSRLGTVFAGPWPSTQASSTLLHARDLVSIVRDFRNRLVHHEPAWKRFGVQTEADALKHLHEKIDAIVSLVALIHPENLRLLEKNGLLQTLRRACTSQEIRRFQHLAKHHKVSSLQKLHALISQSNSDNTVMIAKVFRGRQRRFLLTPM